MRLPLAALGLLLLTPAMAQVQVANGRLCLNGIVNGISYQAHDAAGPVFESGEATATADGSITFALTGPGAADASLSARVSPLQKGSLLEWRLTYKGPERAWSRYQTGFRLDFAKPPTAVATRPVTRWVKPTGQHPWEVPGDTLYPDTECQVREVRFGDTSLAMITPHYDPDWIYGGSVERASFWYFAPPQKPGEATEQMALLLCPTSAVNPELLAAQAEGRPFAIKLSTGRTGNLFAPDEPVLVSCIVTNTAGQPATGSLTLEARSYRSESLLGKQRALALEGGQALRLDYPLRPSGRGVIFVTAHVRWDGGETWQRTTIGVLPTRPATEPREDSPFGLAAVIANPEAYPDHYDLKTVLEPVQRIGARWIRSGWFPCKSDVTEAEEQRVRERVDLLRQFGIKPHVQLGASLPVQEAFQDSFRACLGRFSWVSPYVEVGNELNAAGARPYLEQLLTPVAEAMRQAQPQGQIMSMGLGGVGVDWLKEFEAASGMDKIDILSIHPGCQPRAPEFWEGWRGWVFRSQVQDALAAAARHGNKPVWITEAYAPTAPARQNTDLRTSADYLVRTYLCAIAAGVKVTEWYQFQDGVWFAQRPDPSDQEYSFGIVYTDLTPKPGYVAYATMTEQLEGAKYVGRLDLGADDLYGCRFTRGGQTVDVLWSYREKHETDIPWWPPEKYEKDARKPLEPWVERWQQPVTVSLPCGAEVMATDLMGNTRRVPAQAGTVSLPLTGSSVYVTGLGAMPLKDTFWAPLPAP